MKISITISILLLLALFNHIKSQHPQKRQPNIVFILADDLGYGDLSCYGQKRFLTPNIDRLAAEGIKFLQAYAGTAVCSPSRSSLFTGQHTGHTPIRDNRAVKPEGQFPLPDSTVILPQLLQRAGYATGCFGKWGLGYPGSTGDPVKKGFDEFFGYNSQTLAHNYYPYHLWHNNEKIVLAENQRTASGVYAPELIHEKTMDFIDKHRNEPFALFITTVIPHAEMSAPEAYMRKFRGKFDPETPFAGLDTTQDNYLRSGQYHSQTTPKAAFVAMMTLLDDQVGQIEEKLRQLGIAENTIIVFTSDNGPSQEGGKDPVYFNSSGGLRGLKRDLYEGGIRVPFIVKWPAKTRKGVVSDQPIAFWDVLPTLTEAAGIATPVRTDGISILPTLTGEGRQQQHRFLYWEFYEHGGKTAGRIGRWKGVRLNVAEQPQGPISVYDLQSDPGESTDVSSQNPTVVRQFEELFKKEHVTTADFTYRPKKDKE